MHMWWVMCTCITSGVPIMRHMYRLTSHVYRVMSLVTFGILRDITRCTTSHVESHVMRHVCTDSASCESSHVTRGIRNAAEHDSFYYVTRRVICNASRVPTMHHVNRVMSLVTFGILWDMTRFTTSHVESYVVRHVYRQCVLCTKSRKRDHVTRVHASCGSSRVCHM